METCENLPWAPLAVGLAIISSNVKQSCRGLPLPWACLSSSSIVWQKRKLPRAGALLPCGHAVGSLAVGW